MSNENIQPLYSIGDLVMVDEYESRVWEIRSYLHEADVENGKLVSSIVYELACVVSSDAIFFSQEYVILVCKKKYAIEYLKLIDEHGFAPIFPPNFSTESMSKEESRTYSFRGSKEIDKKLDDLIKVYSAINLIGETEALQLHLKEVESEIVELLNKSLK